MKKLITVIIVSCCFSYNLMAQPLELVSATKQEWDYTPGDSHKPGPYPKGIKYCFNFYCKDFDSIMLDSIFIGSDKSCLRFRSLGIKADTLHHIYSLPYAGKLYMKNRPEDNPIVILYIYNGIEHSLLINSIKSLAPSGEYKMGIR